MADDGGAKATTGIRSEVRGASGVITLDRPAALNALDLTMIRGIDDALTAFEADPAVRAVVVRSDHPKAFCSGGDIRAVRAASLDGRFSDIEAFFAEEYALNRRIAAYPKPYVALVDGICMGGGMGVSVHGSHCIVGDGALMAMPETLIGFFPDVGATWFLSRLAKGNGLYLGLTGARIGAGDAVALGLGRAYVPRDRLAALEAALVDGEDADSAVARLSEPAPEPRPIASAEAEIAATFGNADSLPDLIDRLTTSGSPFANATLESLRGLSPTSLAVTFETVTRGASLDLAGATAMELALTRTVVRSHDFVEGVRAALVDKDRRPRWQPTRIEDVDPASIRALFAGVDG